MDPARPSENTARNLVRVFFNAPQQLFAPQSDLVLNAPIGSAEVVLVAPCGGREISPSFVLPPGSPNGAQFGTYSLLTRAAQMRCALRHTRASSEHSNSSRRESGHRAAVSRTPLRRLRSCHRSVVSTSFTKRSASGGFAANRCSHRKSKRSGWRRCQVYRHGGDDEPLIGTNIR